MYGEDLYGQQGYSDDSHVQSTAEEEKRLVDLEKYVPNFIKEMRELHQVYVSQGYEIGREQLTLEDLFNQIFVDTATWGLDLWEKNYGLKTNHSLSYETRRGLIKNRLNVLETTTAKRIQTVAQELTGTTIWVEELPEKSHINIFIMTRDAIPNNLNVLRDWIELVKPAHLGYTIAVYATRWKDLLSYTWGELKKYTWNGVAIGSKEPVVTWGRIMSLNMTFRILGRQTWTTVKDIEEAKVET